MRPGITGWAQLHGRNLLPWDARIEHDVRYVERCSLKLDLTILLRTALALFTRDGAIATTGDDAGEFWGTATPPSDALHSVPTDETDRNWPLAISEGNSHEH